MGGIGHLFQFLGGAGWLVKKAFREIGEAASDRDNKRLCEAFIAEHSDPTLERRLMEDIKNPAKYEEIWQHLEQYKLQHPELNREHLDHSWLWKTVGRERLPFRDSKGRLYPPRARDAEVLESNRNAVCNLLMESYGKYAEQVAFWRATKKYPL